MTNCNVFCKNYKMLQNIQFVEVAITDAIPSY